MMRRFFNRVRKAKESEPAQPDPVQWRAGDLAECITNGWFCAPRGAPQLGAVMRVQSVHSFGLLEGEPIVTLEFDGVPGAYAAFGFERIEPAPIMPASADFTEQLNEVRERVRARMEKGL